jgi:hypothetical protein
MEGAMPHRWNRESDRRARAARASGRAYHTGESGATQRGGRLLRCACGALVWERDLVEHLAVFHAGAVDAVAAG